MMPNQRVGAYLADVGMRVKLAASPCTPGEVLAYLARDQAVTVRAAAALNPSLTKVADLQLAEDADERVRMLLARKVAGALPGLSTSDEADLRDRTLATLSALVRDEAVRVRTLLAVVMADLPDIPKDLVLTLAQDNSVSVSDPVLRLSPLLSPADLLGLLETPPHGSTAIAIACRADLPAAVSDVIAASADSAAIRALLANDSAAIRETTLDTLVERAHNEPDWHLPLVQRPQLPEHAARALSQIVASNLLKSLAERGDLPASLVTEIQQRLASHLAQPVKQLPGDEALMDEGHRLEEAGRLDEAAVLAIVRMGDVRRTSALLAVAAAVPLEVVDRAASLRSAKALVSLVWKAGFTMRLGVPLQTLLGQLAPGAALTSTKVDGFPIGPQSLAGNWTFLDAAKPTFVSRDSGEAGLGERAVVGKYSGLISQGHSHDDQIWSRSASASR